MARFELYYISPVCEEEFRKLMDEIHEEKGDR